MNNSPTSGGTAKPITESELSEQPFFRGLKPAHLRRLAENAIRLHYQAGDVIFSEGDPANRFYLLERGQVSLESRRQNHPTVRIQTVEPGDVLGWSWLFPPYRWHFDARVLEPTTAIFFYGTRIREDCEQDNDLGYELMKRTTAVAIQRLQAARQQWLASQTRRSD